MQSGKDIIEEQQLFYQLAALITEGKNTEAKSILQNTNLHLKISDLENLTLLHVAVQSGNDNMALHLIHLGSDVEAKTASGLTPLTLAIGRKHKSIVLILIFTAKCDTSYIDGVKELAGIKDYKSIEFEIYLIIFNKQLTDYLQSSEGRANIRNMQKMLM